MDNFNRLQAQIRSRLLLVIIGTNLVCVGTYWLVREHFGLPLGMVVAIIGVVMLANSILASRTALGWLMEPLRAIWQAIIHVASTSNTVEAPELDKLHLAREQVSNLILEVYNLASKENAEDLIKHRQAIIQASNIVSHLPLPLFVCNKEQLVTNASNAALEYCHLESAKLFGQPLYDNLNLEFSGDATLEAWIHDCQANKATDTAYWERVRSKRGDNDTVQQFDVAAYYNRDNPSGAEFIITLFDRTEQYSTDDRNLSFVAVAVHELRTPLTILRGYIEVFEEELQGKLDPEMQTFMQRLQSSAEQLTSFVNNILNVTRIEGNQMNLQLTEAPWEDVLRKACADMELRARVNGKTIEYDIKPDLPAVGIDRVSISEVIYNLLDNAIKYGGDSKRIIVYSGLTQDGLVETTVQDFGVGVAEGVVPTLFEKFHRSHRTRDQVSGTGLGLYISKAITGAHGGEIWASSKEGQGSTFGFTLVPYARLADEQKQGGDSEITRSAHGWIKNHSLYRG
jgi:signal transduction histidine kinase